MADRGHSVPPQPPPLLRCSTCNVPNVRSMEEQKHQNQPDVQVRMQVGKEQERRTSGTTGRLSTPKACASNVQLLATSSCHCCSL